MYVTNGGHMKRLLTRKRYERLVFLLTKRKYPEQKIKVSDVICTYNSYVRYVAVKINQGSILISPALKAYLVSIQRDVYASGAEYEKLELELYCQK
jgi:hypothetical protein